MISSPRCPFNTLAHREASWRYNFEQFSRKILKMGELIDGNQVPIEISTTVHGKKRSRHVADFWGPQASCERYMHLDGDPSCSVGSQDVLLNTDFHLAHFGMVSAVLSSNDLVWHIIELEEKLNMHFMCCWGSSESNDASNKLAMSDIYAVELFEMTPKQSGDCPSVLCSNLSSHQGHYFAVYSYQKSVFKKGTWIPKSYVFWHSDAHVCKRWANQLQFLIDKQIHRPTNLWVIMNPYSGKRTALKTWEEVSPLFNRARINIKVLMTERIRHAFDIMNEASNTELADLDGVVVVGGDGLFNEVLNGFLLRRHRAKWPMKPHDFEKSRHSSYECESQGHKLKSEKGKETETLTAFVEKNEEVDLMTSPASTDLHPLLENLTSEDICLQVSEKPSMYSLISDLKEDDNGTSTMSKVTSAMATNSGSDFSCDYKCIQYKEGGFIIPGSLVTATTREEQTSRPDFACSDPGSVLCNSKFRFGIIPAGSTDSIAISTTGSRDPATSALHIILGKNMPLDIVRLIGWKSLGTTEEEHPRVRYAASFAGYGFYGDVIKESEPNRWMGPLRYDYAGTKVFLKHKLYEAEVSYVELPEHIANSTVAPNQLTADVSWQRKLAKNRLTRLSCRMNCGICAKGIDFSDLDDTSPSSLSPQKKPRWKCSRGSFISVGAAVISCKNDKAPNGVAASAHLADGLLHLILVRECSRPAYLWHLIQLTREESNPLDFSFIEEHKTPQFNFISYGEESVWNVDGELFPANQLSAQVFRGLVNIFASGPDV